MSKTEYCRNQRINRPQNNSQMTVPSSRPTHGVHGLPELVTSDHVTQALVAACIFTEASVGIKF
jgi:hypothetical protein